MQKDNHTDFKPFFNLLRDDKQQITNDNAFNEIIDLFVFYMTDIDLNKKEKKDNKDDNEIIDLSKYKEKLKKEHLTKEQIKLLNNNFYDINDLDDKGLEIKDIKDIKDLEHIFYFSNFNNFENFYKLIKDNDFINIKNKTNKEINKLIKNNKFDIKTIEEISKKNYKNSFEKYNIDIKYWNIINYTPLLLYNEIRRLFHYHNYYKYIFTIEETKISEEITFEGLLDKLLQFKQHKENKDFDFFGQLIESLYTNYLYGSLNNKGKGKSSKNAMGQFFTPQNITDFLIMLIKPQIFKDKKTNKINIGNFAEFACGTGGIIRSYMKWYNLLYDKYNYDKSNINSQFLNHIIGCEKSERIFTLCAANMVMKTGQYMKSLHCGDSIFTDCNEDDIFNKKYNYICINPPFSISWNFDNKKIDCEKNLDNFPLFVGGKNSEWLFMILTLQKLKINGKAAVIVPENNHLYETSGNYHILRELIVRCCEIHKIIRCESGTFTSTSAPTIIIYFTKKNNIEDVLSYILKKGYEFSSNIDFENDTKTKSISKYADIKSYVIDKNILNTNSLSFYDFKDFKDITMEDIIYNKKNIDDIKPNKTIDFKELEKNNFSFMLNDYINKEDLQIKLNDDNINYKKLDEIVNYGKKSNRNADFGKDKGLYNFYCSSEKVKKCDIADYNEEYIIIGDGGVANVKIDNKFSCSNHNFIFKSNNENEIINKYIYYYLKFNKRILQEFYTGMIIKNLSKNDLNKINIPIISIDNQEKIIDKIENEIINNYDVEALNKKFNNTIKAVIFNYTNDCNNLKKLNELYNIKYGNRLNKDNCSNEDGKYPVYGGGISSKGYYNKYNTPAHTIIMAGVVAGYVNYLETPCWIADCCYSFNPYDNTKKEIIDKYMYYVLKSKFKEINSLVIGSIQKHINAVIVGEVNVPIISLEKQKELVKYLDEKYEEINNKQNDKNYIMLSNYLNHLLTNYNNIPDNFNINIKNEIDINNIDEYEYFKLNYNDYINNLSILSFHNINFDDKINDILPLFVNLKELYIINCNNINLIPNNLIYLEKLSIMNDKLPNIKDNNIENLPNSLINLKKLKLSKTYIKELPNEYQNLEELEVIFSDNIKSIPKYNKLKSFTTNCNNGIGLTNIYKGQNVFLNIKQN